MVLSKLPVPKRPTYTWRKVGQGSTALAGGAGAGCLDIFSLIFYYSFLSPLGDGPIYRLKYCLKGPLKPKTTNQTNILPLSGIPVNESYAMVRSWPSGWNYV